MPVEEASRIYGDLHFVRYALTGGGTEEPAKVYRRRSEPRYIGNVEFDAVEYWFKDDRLYRIRAVLVSAVGPRTLVTAAEEAFDRIDGWYRSRYGEPFASRTDYLTEFLVVVREAVWHLDGSVITIRYEGAGRTNEDTLVLLLAERAK